MATATKATKTFAGLRCLHCGEAECLVVKVETCELECQSCSETIEKAEVETMVDRWRKLFVWIDSASEFAAPK
jgi:hypothetical protein